MAKISKKSPGSLPTVEIDNINQFIFEGLEESGLLQPEPITHIPNLDMYSTHKELIIEVELPGVKKDDIEITLSNNNITIKAIKTECMDEEKVNYVCMERSFGRIFRSVELPFPVDTARIKANYKTGVLTIVVPKVEDKRSGVRRVPIEQS